MPHGCEPGPVEYRKLDAALSSALAELADMEAPALAVFVHLERDPSPGDCDRLQGLGLGLASGARPRIVTATLSVRQVAALSREQIVSRLRLSQRLDLRNGRGHPGPPWSSMR